MNLNNLTIGTITGWTLGVAFLITLSFLAIHRAHGAPSGTAEFHHKAGHGFGPHRLFKMIHHLDLTREQREKIGAVMDEHRPQMRTFMLDMLDAKKALQDILNNPSFDEKAVSALAKAQAKNAENMFLSSAAAFAEIGSILTVEQRKELSQRMEKRGKWGRDRHHRNDAGSHNQHDKMF